MDCNNRIGTDNQPSPGPKPSGRSAGREEKADRDHIHDHMPVNVDVDVVVHVHVDGRCGLFENPGTTTLNAEHVAQVLCRSFSTANRITLEGQMK